jgi:hypothetical protein
MAGLGAGATCFLGGATAFFGAGATFLRAGRSVGGFTTMGVDDEELEERLEDEEELEYVGPGVTQSPVTVMVCVQLTSFPQALVAVHVRVMLYG